MGKCPYCGSEMEEGMLVMRMVPQWVKKGEKKGFLQKVGLMNLVMLLIAGIALIWIAGLGLDQTPSKKTAKKTNQTAGTSLESNPIYTNNSSESGNYAKEMEDKLTNILSKVEGIGKVQVMITISESKELVTLKDAPYTQDSVNENDGEGGSRISSKYSKEDSTVMITENGENAPYIIKEKEPLIKGVLVIAQGGNDATVKVNIVEAVEALFDLPVHKIKVMKMGTK